jgi:hypothetical protein
MPQLLLPELLLPLLLVLAHLQQSAASLPAPVKPLQMQRCLQDSCQVSPHKEAPCMPLYGDGCPLLH